MLNWLWFGKLLAMDPWVLTPSAVLKSEVCDASVEGDRRYPDVWPPGCTAISAWRRKARALVNTLPEIGIAGKS
eukprot:8485546-Pyramimonas_sp.AAC.1